MSKTLQKTMAALLFLIAAGLFMVFYYRVFSPEPYMAPPVPQTNYDQQRMRDAVAPERIKAEQDKILAFGNRFLGSKGYYDVGDYIRDRYEAAGLEVYEQHNRTLAPKTLRREILDAQGHPLPDVEVYPFFPNHLQPQNSPPEGTTGELVLLTEDLLNSGRDFTNMIGLLDARVGHYPKNYDLYWLGYARLGLKAMIVAHPDGFSEMPWFGVAAGMVSSSPVNYVRVAATEGIFNHLGETITLHVRTKWENTVNPTYIGVLRAANPTHKAMVLAASRDAASCLSDVAQGGISSIQPAFQLALLDGLTQYRDSLQRDIFFVSMGAQSMGCDGHANLLRILGPNTAKAEDNQFMAAFNSGNNSEPEDDAPFKSKQEQRLRPIIERLEHHEERLATVKKILAAFDDTAFFDDSQTTRRTLRGWDSDTETFFREQAKYVLDTIVFELSEEQLQAKIAFERDLNEDIDSPEFAAYMDAKHAYDAAFSAAGFSIENLLERKPDYVLEKQVRDRLVDRFTELSDYHQEEVEKYIKDKAIIALFNPYSETIMIQPQLAPAFDEEHSDEVVSFDSDEWQTGTAAPVFNSLLAAAKERAGLADSVETPALSRDQINLARQNTPNTPFAMIKMWRRFGYPAFRILNFGRFDSYLHNTNPVVLPYMRDLESLRKTFVLVAETVNSLAHGSGTFAPPRIDRWIEHYGGKVLVSGIGQSIVPNYPLKNAVLGTRGHPLWYEFSTPGFYTNIFMQADPYGEYDFFNQVSDFNAKGYFYLQGNGYSPIAVGYGKDGLIQYMKDEGEERQRQYRSVGLWADANQTKDVTIITFRASAVSITDLVNPQTYEEYAGMTFVRKDGIVPFKSRCLFESSSLKTAYLPPDERFYVMFADGEPGNELALTIRAFMLGINDNYVMDPEKEIDGAGYLVSDTPTLLKVPQEIAKSMAYVNGKRLELQQRYNMADERTLQYQERTEELLHESEDPTLPEIKSKLEAREAVTYATLNHPVIRESVTEAVIGILWYLALLVPFVFFFEKLLFCFSDVRKQIAAQAIIFVLSFGLLRLLHPAFEMVRSSLMILLGFIIILISTGITVLFSGKFRENFEELRKKQGKFSAAEVNTLGVIMTSFMLGLNNMNRRRVRTGLTCATLSLITFVMICFTSLESDLVDNTTAVGKAPYQGLLIKRERFGRLTITEFTALNERYGNKRVHRRLMALGGESFLDQRTSNPNLEIHFEKNGDSRALEFDSILNFSVGEPLRKNIRFESKPYWFTEEDTLDEGICKIMVPDKMAEKLGMTVEDVEAGNALVTVNGREFQVCAIFDSDSVNALKDLDGLDLLPFDIEAMDVVPKDENFLVVADEKAPRIGAERLIIAPIRYLRIQNDVGEIGQLLSVAVSFSDMSYKDAKEEIESYLEESSKPTYYGLDGTAYRGERTRQRSLAGALDMLVPLLIAALTVLNTMRGSVYERRDEIFVYNAVGIAPRFVFFMFIAEAVVYAVVGSILGYLLSQGTGRILTELGLTGGMSMTYTSISTIYVSIAIALSVFLSTYFPARAAMRIAAPAEESGWTLPAPEGDKLNLCLPFTFSPQGRIAVLAFFERYLQDHGEGGAGPFHAGESTLGLREALDLDGGYVPQLEAGIWLKPFDLGVSQTMTITLPTDPETNEYQAWVTLTRLSGSREAWLRLNHYFVARIRRHFLHWRAVTPEERAEMLAEAEQMLRGNVLA